MKCAHSQVPAPKVQCRARQCLSRHRGADSHPHQGDLALMHLALQAEH